VSAANNGTEEVSDEDYPSPYEPATTFSNGTIGGCPGGDGADISDIERRRYIEEEKKAWLAFKRKQLNGDLAFPKNKRDVVELVICEVVCNPCDYPEAVRQHHRTWFAQQILPAVSTGSITFLYRFVTTLSFCPRNTNALRDVFNEFGDYTRQRNVDAELTRLSCDISMTASAVGNPIYVGLALPGTACNLRNGMRLSYFVITGTGSSALDEIIVRHEIMHTVSAVHYSTIASDGRTNLMHSGFNIPNGIQRGAIRLAATVNSANNYVANNC